VTQAVAYGVRQEEEGHGAKEHKENEENEEGSADPSPMGSGADLWLDRGSIFVVAGPAASGPSTSSTALRARVRQCPPRDCDLLLAPAPPVSTHAIPG
jgi:hypothetical protein